MSADLARERLYWFGLRELIEAGTLQAEALNNAEEWPDGKELEVWEGDRPAAALRKDSSVPFISLKLLDMEVESRLATE